MPTKSNKLNKHNPPAKNSKLTLHLSMHSRQQISRKLVLITIPKILKCAALPKDTFRAGTYFYKCIKYIWFICIPIIDINFPIASWIFISTGHSTLFLKSYPELPDTSTVLGAYVFMDINSNSVSFLHNTFSKLFHLFTVLETEAPLSAFPDLLHLSLWDIFLY